MKACPNMDVPRVQYFHVHCSNTLLQLPVLEHIQLRYTVEPSKGQMSGQNLWHHVIRGWAIVLITLVFISSNQQMTAINISANSKAQVHLFYCIYNLPVIKVTRSTKVSWGTCMSFLALKAWWRSLDQWISELVTMKPTTLRKPTVQLPYSPSLTGLRCARRWNILKEVRVVWVLNWYPWFIGPQRCAVITREKHISWQEL